MSTIWTMEYSNCNSRQFLFCGWRPWCWGCLNLKLDLAEIWCSHFQGDLGWHVGNNEWPGIWWWYHHYNHDYADDSNDQPSLTTRVKRGGACETTKDCVAGNVCSKYYSKVSLNISPILPWISCPLHAMQFISVNIVILKKVGLVSMDKHLWKWWSQSGQSIFVKTMIFSKMTVSEVLTIIMTNMKPWPWPEPRCIDYSGCCSSRKRPSGTMQDFGRLCFKGEKDDILFEGRRLPTISFEGALLQRAWLLPWRKVIKLTSSSN